jgi:hypothetical protein
MNGRLEAMNVGEHALARSITAAVSRDVTLQRIVSEVIRPILEDSVVVTDAAQNAVGRALGMATRG